MNPSSFETTKYNGIRSLIVDLWIISQSNENNQSVIGWQIHGNSTVGNWYTTKNIHLDLNGVRVYDQGTGSINLDENTVVASGQITVTHNIDGKKKIPVYLEGGIFYYTSYKTVSGESDITPIPRISPITATDGYIESSSSININRYVSTYKHKLYYKFTGQADYTLIAENIDTNYGWIIPASAYALIPNDPTIACTIKCETYSNTTLIGSSTTTMTATVNPETCSPEILSVLLEDINPASLAVLEQVWRCLKFISNINVEIDASPKQSSTISSYKVTCGDGKTADTRLSLFNAVESGTFTIEVTDSRGYKTTEIHSMKFWDFTKLTLNANIYRSSINDEMAIVFNGNYSGEAGIYNNELLLKYRYKEKGTSYINPTLSIATPCVVTYADHGLANGTAIVFTTTGALPTGMVANTVYYARSIDANTFNIYETSDYAIEGGSTGRISTSGTQSGTHLLYKIITPTIDNINNKYNNGEDSISLGSVFDYQTNYDFEIIATDLIYQGDQIKVEQTVAKWYPTYWWDETTFNLEAQGYQGANKLLNTGDISDSLIGTSTEKALSENQGKTLDDKINRTKVCYMSSNAGVLIKLPDKNLLKMMTFEIIGNGYGSNPINTIIQGYQFNTEGNFINCKQKNFGASLSAATFMIYDGVVCLWVPSVATYSTYVIKVYESNLVNDQSIITTVSGDKPAGSHETVCTIV